MRQIQPIVVLLSRWPHVSFSSFLLYGNKKEAAYITIDVVGVDCITALGPRKRDTIFHNAADIWAAKVQPPLAGPSVERLAQIRLVEAVFVGPEVLVRARAEVADDLLPIALQRLKRRCVVVKEVQVEDADVRIWGRGRVVELDGVLEHDLPCRIDAGLPRRCSIGTAWKAFGDNAGAGRAWAGAVLVRGPVTVSLRQADAQADPESDGDNKKCARNCK